MSKKRSDGRRWTSEAQENWLNSQIPEYLEASAKHRYDKFWPPVFEKWFKEFPESDPDSDDPTDFESDSESDRNAPPSDNDSPVAKISKKRKRQRHPKAGKKVCKLATTPTRLTLIISGLEKES